MRRKHHLFLWFKNDILYTEESFILILFHKSYLNRKGTKLILQRFLCLIHFSLFTLKEKDQKIADHCEVLKQKLIAAETKIQVKMYLIYDQGRNISKL